MYKIIHLHDELELEGEINALADEGWELVDFKFEEGSEYYHYIAILELEEDEDEDEEEDDEEEDED